MGEQVTETEPLELAGRVEGVETLAERQVTLAQDLVHVLPRDHGSRRLLNKHLANNKTIIHISKIYGII